VQGFVCFAHGGGSNPRLITFKKRDKKQ